MDNIKIKSVHVGVAWYEYACKAMRDVDTLRATSETKDAELSAERYKAITAAIERDEAEERVKELETVNVSLNEAQTNNLDRIAELEAEIEDKNQKIDTLFSALRGEQGILDGETGEVLHPCAERDAAEARVKELEEKNRRLTVECNVWNSTVEELEAQLAEALAYWEECQVEHNKRNLECQRLRKDTARLDWAQSNIVKFLNAVDYWNNLGLNDPTTLRAAIDGAREDDDD